MKKNYFYIILLLFLFTLGAQAQENKHDTVGGKESIEGLNISPNPASSDRIYITTKLSESKEVDIFDVLGKKVLHATLTGKELNISELTPGVYIIKIKEGEATATRKLIVK
ncbi:secretion protein [Flavobacterium akiainvivens]|uniref:Secretion protein n=1 Tax=Flavobacterium akiainvivens TaxID=1202724 RepID=A0A0M9VIE4_9FLAO|nr:T9SS type A sorting domain-containing protein [Flavobacterium akiainvivens]KOS06616.1 secretion protein [Flavobacterium akiainvivens]SFQ09044.1 Por secretion system C-terminal sorting domain-containing protein [Flavobacterium akiainvivens]